MLADARVLQPDYLPDEELLVHRNATLNALAAALQPVLEGQPPGTVHVTGPSGAGKTTVTKFALDALREEALAIDTAYVNCWEDHSGFAALFRATEQLTTTADLHRSSTAEDVLLDRLRDREGPAVVVLDEVDQLEEPRTLYQLYNVPTCSLVLVTNRQEALFSELPTRVANRLRPGQRIEFDAYEHAELVAILKRRVEHGLRAGAVGEGVLERIASAAAGDAHAAIGTLRVAVELAQERGADRVTEALLADAIPQARHERRQRSLSKLTPDQRALYECLQAAGDEGLAPRTLYDRYVEAVDDPVSKRTMRAYLGKLERYNLIRSEGRGPAKRYVVRNTIANPEPNPEAG